MAIELFPEFHVIIVPGLHDSGPEHWQSRWRQRHPEFARVRQDDWDHPHLRTWAARLDQVRGADQLPALALPCPAIMVARSNDPWMRAEDADRWARRWGCERVEGGPLGHINAESGLGDWSAGQRLLHWLAEMAHNRQVAFSA